MKYSALYPVVAGLALGAMLLPATALAEKKTAFTSTETDKTQNFPWFANGPATELYMFDGKATFDMVSSDSRVAGSGWYSMYAIYNLTNGAATLWGQYHIENGGGAWDGYWSGSETQDGFMATLVGSGEYEGLVSRWTSTAHGSKVLEWSGYIVENGPGEVPFKNSGWREENVELISMTPPFAKATSFGAGAGQGSHLGIFTDVKEVGLMNLLDGTGRGTGIAKAANGDLLTWVSFGAMDSNGNFGFKIFFAGGTGRFEHAVGSWEGEFKYTTPTRYTYRDTGTGTIRY